MPPVKLSISAIVVSTMVMIASGCESTRKTSSNNRSTANPAPATTIAQPRPAIEMLPTHDWDAFYRSLPKRQSLSSSEIAEVMSGLNATVTGKIVAATVTINGFASRFPQYSDTSEHADSIGWFRPSFSDFETPAGQADGANWLWELRLDSRYGSRTVRAKLWYEHYLMRTGYPMGNGSPHIMYTIRHSEKAPWHRTKIHELVGSDPYAIGVRDILGLASGMVTASPIVTPTLFSGVPALSAPQLVTHGYAIREGDRTLYLLTWQMPALASRPSIASTCTSCKELSILADRESGYRLRALILHDGARAGLVVEYRGLTRVNGVVWPSSVHAQWFRVWRETEDSTGIVLSNTITVTSTDVKADDGNAGK